MVARPASLPDAGCNSERPFRASRIISGKCCREMRERSPRKACQSWLSPLGLDDPVFVDEEMADPDGTNYGAETKSDGKRSSHLYITVLLFASVIYIGCIVSP